MGDELRTKDELGRQDAEALVGVDARGLHEVTADSDPEPGDHVEDEVAAERFRRRADAGQIEPLARGDHRRSPARQLA